MTAQTIAEPESATATFNDVLYGRRSVRAYKPQAIDESTIRALLDAAVHAPTAMHEEPWEFVVVQDRALLRRISDRAKQLASDDAAQHGRLLKPPGAAGDGFASPLADPAFNIFYDAGTLVVISAKPVSSFVEADCWLAAENLMLAAHANGLGTCCIGFAIAELNTAAAKAELQIPADRRVFAAIIVGVPRDEPRVIPRKAPVVVNWIQAPTTEQLHE
jgi:nitroreductase